MKKIWIRLFSLICCALFLSATVLAAAKSGAGQTLPISVKATIVKEPPYYIHLEDDLNNDTGFMSFLGKIVIDGKRDTVESGDHVVGDGWTFAVYFETGVREYGSPSAPAVVVVKPWYSHMVMTGTKDVTMTDSSGKTNEPKNIFDQYADKQAKKQATIDKINQWLAMTPEQVQEAIQKELDKQNMSQAKTLCKASFTVPCDGDYAPDCSDGVLKVSETGASAQFTYKMDYDYVGHIDMKVELTVDELDYVKATVDYTTVSGYPVHMDLDGYFTCQKEIDADFSAKKDIPIWGSWTDNDVYTSIPKIMKDFDKRQGQLAALAADPKAKVDTVTYNNGKWLTLTKGKKIQTDTGGMAPPGSALDPKNTPYTYTMIQVTDDFILYETGELWLGIDSFACHPGARYKFPRDAQNNNTLYSQPLENYALPLDVSHLAVKYNDIADTLTPSLGFFLGTTLHRIQDVLACDTWTSEKGVEMPDPKTVRDTPGLWYDIKAAKGSYTDSGQKDADGNPILTYTPSPNGGYTYTKLTVNQDGTAEAISGRAEVYSLDDTLLCYIDKKTVYDASGKATDTVYGTQKDANGKDTPIPDYEADTFILTWSQYSKDAGTIKLNGQQFYKATKATLNGTWCTAQLDGSPGLAPQLPDTSQNTSRESLSQYADMTEWFKFDSSKRTFTHLTWLGDGKLLIETGTFKTFDDGTPTASFLLENIVGTYYSDANTLVFENQPRAGGADSFAYYTNSSGNLYVSDTGWMYKAK